MGIIADRSVVLSSLPPISKPVISPRLSGVHGDSIVALSGVPPYSQGWVDIAAFSSISVVPAALAINN